MPVLLNSDCQSRWTAAYLAMSGAIHTGDTHGMRRTPLHASPRLLLFCLAASLAFHVLVFAFFPGWMRVTVAPPAPVLDVVIASAEPESVPALPLLPSPEVQRRLQPSPQTVLPDVINKPERLPTETPIAVTQPNPAVPPALTVPVEPSRPAVETKPAPVARVEAVTPPAYNAAYLRNPPPRYPQAARRNGDEGTVMLRVLVNPEGAPVQVELDRSSGSSPLDSAAVDAVRNWRFVPARRGTQNVEGWVRVPIVFRLEGIS